MPLLRISVLLVLCLSYTTIDANGCLTENHIYRYIHLPSDIIRFSVTTSLDFNTTEGHFLFTSNFSQSPFYFDIAVKSNGSNELKIIKSTCDFNGSIDFFEPTEVYVHTIVISYEDGYIMIKHINGSTIVQSRQKTFTPRYFWYDRDIQISGCVIGLGDQCSAEYSGYTLTQPLEVKCTLTKCIWNIDSKKDQFEKCDTNCKDKIPNCTDYLSEYEPKDEKEVRVDHSTIPASGTSIPTLGTHITALGTPIPALGTHIANTEGTLQMRLSTELITTAGKGQSENNNMIGKLTTVETTVNDDTFVDIWNQLIVAKYTEYCNTDLELERNTTNLKDLDDQCSAKYYETTATQSSEEKCALTECIWKINNEVRLFEECNTKCTQAIAKCIGFLSQNDTQNNANTTSATGTSLPMNTGKNVQNQNRGFPATTEPQNLLWTRLTTVETTVIENNDTSDRLWKQLITEMYAEYCNSGLGLKTRATVTGLTDVKDTNVTPTGNAKNTDDTVEPRIHWTDSIILLIAFTGAGVGTFVIGSICVLHGLLHEQLRNRKGCRVSPEEATSYK